MLCPKCGSADVEKRDHEQKLKTISGILMTSAGATAGTVNDAATNASTGAAIGAVAGPLGVILVERSELLLVQLQLVLQGVF